MLNKCNTKGKLRAGAKACTKSEQAFAGDRSNNCKFTFGYPNYNFLRKIEAGNKLAKESSGYSLSWTSKEPVSASDPKTKEIYTLNVICNPAELKVFN